MALMRHTRRSDEWIREMSNRFPVREKVGTDGKPTGIFDSGLVRFSYPRLLTPFSDRNDKTKEPGYSLATWFTPLSQLFPVYTSAVQLVAAHQRSTPEDALRTCTPGRIPDKIAGIATPFHDQAEKANKDGYTPGCMFMNMKCDLKHKPSIMCMRNGVRTNMTAEEDHLIYGGMWGIATFRLYMIDANNAGPNPYPARLCCGLMGAFVLAGDTAIGASRLDADAHYGSIDGGEDIGDMGGMPASFDGGTGGAGGAGGAFGGAGGLGGAAGAAFTQGGPGGSGGFAAGSSASFDWGQQAQAAQNQYQPAATQWTAEQIAYRRSMGLPV
jgi:Protein of unknown function (DUF2815)